jgi:asparagine synthetase B (glutamine-hydrolysing)
LYTLLFEKNNLPPADFGYLLFFWPTKYREKSANFKTDLIKLNVSAENGMKILKEVHTIVNNPKPDSHSDCEYCMYRRVGEGFED